MQALKIFSLSIVIGMFVLPGYSQKDSIRYKHHFDVNFGELFLRDFRLTYEYCFKSGSVFITKLGYRKPSNDERWETSINLFTDIDYSFETWVYGSLGYGYRFNYQNSISLNLFYRYKYYHGKYFCHIAEYDEYSTKELRSSFTDVIGFKMLFNRIIYVLDKSESIYVIPYFGYGARYKKNEIQHFGTIYDYTSSKEELEIHDDPRIEHIEKKQLTFHLGLRLGVAF